jgi:hypothetical protein
LLRKDHRKEILSLRQLLYLSILPKVIVLQFI